METSDMIFNVCVTCLDVLIDFEIGDKLWNIYIASNRHAVYGIECLEITESNGVYMCIVCSMFRNYWM